MIDFKKKKNSIRFSEKKNEWNEDYKWLIWSPHYKQQCLSEVGNWRYTNMIQVEVTLVAAEIIFLSVRQRLFFVPFTYGKRIKDEENKNHVMSTEIIMIIN